MLLFYLPLSNNFHLTIQKEVVRPLNLKRIENSKRNQKKAFKKNNSFNFFQISLQPLVSKGKHLILIKSSKSYEKIHYSIYPSRFIFWFRDNLNFEENLSLKFAMSLPISPIFIYCLNSSEKEKWGHKRKHFLKKTLKNLRTRLWSNNIEIFISNRNANELIPLIARKYKSTKMIYSLNTFVPLNFKKERILMNKLNKIGIKPIIFLFNPLNMKVIYSFLKIKFTNFYSFISSYYYQNEHYSKKNIPNNCEFINEFKNKKYNVDKRSINKNIKTEKKFIKNSFTIYKVEELCIENIDQSYLNPFLIKAIFSEFNFGYRNYFITLIKKNVENLNNLIESIINNSLLKYFFLTKKIRKKITLFSTIVNII
jgi:hypothetical protein